MMTLDWRKGAQERIHMDPIDPKAASEQANNDIDFASQDADDSCVEMWHSERCQLRMEYLSEPCIQLQAQLTRKRKHRLKSLHMLKACVNGPWIANGERTLEGMACGGCIYETR
jgi:hypothetical protein